MLQNKNSAKSFAIFVRSSYGDLLMTDPLIKYIKSLNINNKITLFVEDKNFQLVEFMENIDNCYTIPSKGNNYFFFIFYGLRYRKNKYDISIAAKTGVGSANGFFQYMLGANKQISYVNINKTWTDKLVNYPIVWNEEIYQNQHYALGVLQLLENKFKEIPKHLYPKLKKQFNPSINGNIKLLVSVSNNRKSCTLENKIIATIINTISQEFKVEIYISALEKDYRIAENLKNQIIQYSIISTTPKLKNFIQLITNMDICFTGEGGLMHIAAALHIPQVVLFGGTSTTTWTPLSDKALIISDKSNVNNISTKHILDSLRIALLDIKKSRSSY
jgi:ADP-heptose:LPS heptosyltransferase